MAILLLIVMKRNKCITSGTMSPTLSKAIAMGYVLKEFSDIGMKFLFR